VVRVSATARARQQPHGGPLRNRLDRRGPCLSRSPTARPAAAGVRRLVAAIDGRSAEEVFGWPDDLKLRSSMTLFSHAAADNHDFVAVLEKFYDGEEDPATVAGRT